MKALIRPLYNRLTAGETIASFDATVQNLRNQSIYPIADYIKEYAVNDTDIEQSVKEYKTLANVAGLDYIALKPSSFRFQAAPFHSLVQHLVAHKKKVLIDAEDVANQDAIHKLTDDCLEIYNKDAVWIYKTYQMYRRDSLARLASDLQRFPFIGVKLVRGAYMKQDKGTGMLYTQKADTDAAFRKAVQLSLGGGGVGGSGLIHTMVCTHNALDIRYLIEHQKNNRAAFVHASLYGFIPKDTQLLVNASIPTYKYLPYGPMEAAIPYLMRRVQENPYVLRYYFS